jgi:hypothetical protein
MSGFLYVLLGILNTYPDVLYKLCLMRHTFISLAVSVNRIFVIEAMNNPAQVYKKPLHSVKVTVCCGVSSFTVIRIDFTE